MKDHSARTKVVIRHLPPTLSDSALSEQIDARFAGRYSGFCFRPGKNNHKHQRYSRAYIDFRRAEDVVEFAEFFDGHLFVNEKGTQVKAMVEYAPSQRIPKSWSRKDSREGTILKDAEYLEFLEHLAKPVENLPSAEIQLEKREAERAGVGKEPPIITPLMDFVRQKRAAKGAIQRLSSNGKLSRKAMVASPGNSRSNSLKQGLEKRRASTSVYVRRDNTKSLSGKEKLVYISASDKSNSLNTEAAADMIMDESGSSGAVDLAKKKVLLLKGKEQEIFHSVTSVRNSLGSPAIRNSQRREVGGRVIRSILSNKESRQIQSSKVVHSEPQIQTLDKEKKPPRPTNIPSILRNHLTPFSAAACNSDSDVKGIADVGGESQGSSFITEKQDKRTRNKDRPDRSVWSYRRSNGSHGGDENLSLSESLEGISISHRSQAAGAGKGECAPDSGEKHRSFMSSQVDIKTDVLNTTRSVEVRTIGSIRSGSSLENGANRHGRRGLAHIKDVDGSVYGSEGKPPKRGGATGYALHEKRVWVQKSGSGS